MSDELGRPRLSRYDRPALSLADLLRAEGTDFIYQAVWTIHGRRVDRAAHGELLVLLDQPGGKYAVLDRLHQSRPPEQGQSSLLGLGQILLVERRRYTPLVGPVIAEATRLVQRYPLLAWPFRFVRSIPGKFRWALRHTRKFAVRIAGNAGMPTRMEMRRTFRVAHEPPAPDMTERAIWIYRRLCHAVDEFEGLS